MRSIIRRVLTRIRKRCPADFIDLQELVQEIVPLSKQQSKDGTRGEWKAHQPDPEDRRTWGYGFDRTPGKLLLADSVRSVEDAVATVAHEFGHACTRWADSERRGTHLKDEWSSELAADWYAWKKWGFGKEIAQSQKDRDFLHHGPKRGELFEFANKSYKVTRNFCIRPRDRPELLTNRAADS